MEKHIGPVLFRLVNEITRRNDLLFAKYDLNGNQARLIGFIRKRQTSGDVYQQMIEEEWNIRRSSVTSSLGILENKGFINREVDALDSRKKKVFLTEKGVKLSNQIHDNISLTEEVIRNSLSQEKYDELIDILENITLNLSKEVSEDDKKIG